MRLIEASTAIVLVIIGLQAAVIVALLVQRARGRAAVRRSSMTSVSR